ncbi:cytochrome c4 [Candidatus Halobeggiatoa sp. HSG11]|nr:cytochrome c4 [Candidatus Halobeggiatoa sp. HSG11]
MHSKTFKYVALTAGLMVSPLALAAGDAPSLLVGTCISCHGTSASTGPATPSIGGIMENDDFVTSMQDYRDDKVPSTIMGRIARGYSDDDFKAMAEYYGSQKFERPTQTFDKKKAKKGKKIHNKYCEKKCHEDDGYNNKKGVLAGQWMPYLEYTLADFHDGLRKTGKERKKAGDGKMEKKMKKMLDKEGKEGLENLVHFYGSQTKSK